MEEVSDRERRRIYIYSVCICVCETKKINFKPNATLEAGEGSADDGSDEEGLDVGSETRVGSEDGAMDGTVCMCICM